MKRSFLIFAVIACAPLLQAQSMVGNWKEPGGSIIRISQCSTGICLTMFSLSPTAPGTADVHNPDSAKRRQPLCNLQIGGQFHLSDPAHASGGWLYDPKSGNTYHGTITAEGDTLKLRGYIGISLFGRTETWYRASGAATACSKAEK
jgi:uncharacterized protein (DUF2147 family)